MTAATVSVPEAAGKLGVHPQALYREVRDPESPVPSIRIGRAIRIPVAPLDAFLATGHWPAPLEADQ